MSRLQRRRKAAIRRGCFVYRKKSAAWDVFVEREWLLGPRDLSLSKRQAVALAYSIAIAPLPKLKVEVL